MQTAPPTPHATRSLRIRWTVVVLAALALASWVLVAFWPPQATTATRTETIAPAADVEPDRGVGDPCSLRLDRSGGFQEGLGPPNRCPVPVHTPPVTGRIP